MVRSHSRNSLPEEEDGSLDKAGTLQLFKEDKAVVTPRYKGVVLQQTGHWGAQIYVQQSRIWLGTFKSEDAAARAYDSAAAKLHRCDTYRNFPFNDITVHEPAFQERFTADAVLDMIKDGSYEPKLADFIRAKNSGASGGGSTATTGPAVTAGSHGVICKEMFQKELTPSDVGKLNRLVIPKKHATRYLPPVSSDTVEELLLEFWDRGDRPWVFRYCYWRSSQSYVFTKGWNKFVKEKQLRAKDTVVFHRCEEREGLRRSYCMIDVVRGEGSSSAAGAGSLVEDVEGAEEEEEEEVMSEPVRDADECEENKEMKLFGVWIR